MPINCRYPDPDEQPETCLHKYFTEDVDKPFKCRRDGLVCEVECEPKLDTEGENNE